MRVWMGRWICGEEEGVGISRISAVTREIGGGCIWAVLSAGLVSKFPRWAGGMDRESGGLPQRLLLFPHVLLNRRQTMLRGGENDVSW